MSMATCNDIRDVLLDLLYGLVEGPAEQELQAHVAGCSACQTDLEDARRQQKLLARAAHIFKEVPVFVPPEETPVSPEEPAIVKMVPEDRRSAAVRPRRRHLIRWAAAAAVLLAAGSALFYQARLHQHQVDFSQAKKQVQQIDAQATQLQESFPKKQAELAAQVPVRFMHIQVMGPVRREADAPTPIQVRTTDPSGKPVSARIIATLQNNGKEIARAQTTSGGEATITLPPVSEAGAAQLLVEAREALAVARVQRDVQVDDSTLITHLVTNKSVYQVGESILFRTLTLQRSSLRPAVLQPEKRLDFVLRDSEGKQPRKITVEVGPGGISGGDMSLPLNLMGGEYTLHVTSRDTRLLPQERRLTIVRDLPPRITFDRQHYQPGDTVAVQFKAGRPVRGQVTNQVLNVQAEADGKGVSVNGGDPAKPAQVRTDAQGDASFQIKLPAALEKGQVTIQIEGGAKLSQAIPLAGAKLSVEFFPEGSDLVAGVPNRVYYRIRNERGEPVNPQGHITVTSQDNTKILDADQKQPLGVFTFVPRPNEKYRLRLTYPNGMTESGDAFKDLVVRAQGTALSVAEPVSPEHKSLRVDLRCTEDGQRLLIVATCRGQVVAQKDVPSGRGRREVTLDLVKGTRGIVRVTLYGAGGTRLAPLAERLIYRVPAERLSLSIADWKPVQRPGEPVNWKVQVTNEQGGSELTWLLAAVVDQKVMGPADLRAPKPHVQFYLAGDVRRPEDLENADLLLLDSPDSRRALDLFLGTQGWRRFAAGSEAPALAVGNNLFSAENDNQANLLARVNTELKRSFAELRQDTLRESTRLQDERERGAAVAQAAFRTLADFENVPATYLRTGAGILMVTLLLAGAAFLVFGLARVLRRTLAPTNAFAGAFGALTACLVLYAMSGSLPVANDIQFPELAQKALPPLPRDGTPNLQPGAERGLPTGSFAMVPGAGGDSAQPHGGDFVTADIHARLLNREKLPMIAPLAMAIPPVPKPLSNQSQHEPNTKLPLSAPTEVPASLRIFRYQASANPTQADTLYWHPILVAENGSAQISFGLPGNITSYRVLLYGNSASGRLGVFQAQLDVRP